MKHIVSVVEINGFGVLANGEAGNVLQIIHLLSFTRAILDRRLQGFLRASVFALHALFRFGESVSKADRGGLILEDNIEGTAEKGEHEDQEDEGELDGTFFIPSCYKVERDKKADRHQ